MLGRHAPDDAAIAVDVGNDAYRFGRCFECRRQSILMSGYPGSIGLGSFAAMGAGGAVLADRSGRRVVAEAGDDGGIGQYMSELTTAVTHSRAPSSWPSPTGPALLEITSDPEVTEH